MAKFNKAIEFVLENDGGFVFHPNDPGGATNHGVSLRTLRQLEDNDLDDWNFDKDGDVDADDVKLMAKGAAIKFYEKHFWSKYFDRLLDQQIATKVFDMAINMGQRQAVKILQRARNQIKITLIVDGVIGLKTVGAVNEISSTLLHYLIIAEQARFYFDLVDKKPSRGVFLLGWLRRAYLWPA